MTNNKISNSRGVKRNMGMGIRTVGLLVCALSAVMLPPAVSARGAKTTSPRERTPQVNVSPPKPAPRPDVAQIQRGLHRSLKARASSGQNPCLVVGHIKGTIKNTYRDKTVLGTLTVGVQAPYEAQYGYRLDIKEQPYTIAWQADKLVITLRPPVLLFDPSIKLSEIWIYHSDTTRLRTRRSEQWAAQQAQKPMTRMAAEQARRKITNNRDARENARSVIRDVVLDFMAQLHPDLAAYYHGKIEIRFIDDPSVPVDLLTRK